MAYHVLSRLLIGVCILLPMHSFSRDSFRNVDKINVKADTYSGSLARGVVRGEGNIRVTAGDTTLTADKVEVNLETGEFQAEGNPVKIIVRDGDNSLVWTGTVISGNIRTKVFNVGKYFAVYKPWYITAESSERNEEGSYIFKGGKFSSCEELLDDNFFTPWYMRVAEIEIEREEVKTADGDVEVQEWITLKHPILQIYGIPVFYWPWAMFQREWLENIQIKQGQEKDWGWYIHISYRTAMIKRLWDATYQVEHYEKRGTGFEMGNVISGDSFNSDILLYYLNDREPLSDNIIAGVTYNAGNETPRDRYRINSFTQVAMAQNLTLRNKLAYQSDPDLMYEFRSRRYNLDPEPNSYLDMSYLAEQFEGSVNVTAQLNDFQTTLEKRPEIRLDVPRQPLFGSSLYYQSRNAIADLKMSFREYDYGLAPDNRDYSATRFDSAHMLYSPIALGWLNVLPRAGFRFTWYDRSSAGAVTDADLQALINSNLRRNGYGTTAPVQYDANGDDISRSLVEVGVELNVKAQADWNFQSNFLNMDGIQHTVIPYINYTRIPEEGEGERDHIYFFDEVDRIREVNMVRIGLDQYFRTNRTYGENRRNEVFFRMENYFDYYFDPENGLESEGDFGTDIDIIPADWMRFRTVFLYDSHDFDLNTLRSSMRLGTRYQLKVGYFFRNDYTERYNYSFGSDLTRWFGTGFFPLSYTENHSVSTSLTIPVGNKDIFMYTLNRDLTNKETSYRSVAWKRRVNCWSFSVGLSQTVTAKAVELSLFLTDKPDAQLGYSYDYDTVED